MLISFNWTADALPETVKLSDALGAYGVRNKDTLEVIVADGTDMVSEGGGLYTYEFDSEEDVDYEYVIEIVSETETYRITRDTVEESSDPPDPVEVFTLRFALLDQGEFVNADEIPTLSNPSSTYGVIRMDTQEVMLADGSTFGVTGIGHYSRGFIAPEDVTKYQYYVEVLYNDTTYHLPRTTEYVKSAALVFGRYTNSEAIGRFYNMDNLHKWIAVSDKDEPVDYAVRLYEMIALAEQRVDEILENSPYVDLTLLTSVPKEIAFSAMLLSGVYAYESRGVVDFNPVDGTIQHRLHYQRTRAEDTLKKIARGRIKLAEGLKPQTIPTVFASPTTFDQEPYVSGDYSG